MGFYEYNGELCVEVRWLIDNCITTQSAYDKMVQRGRVEVARRGGNNNPALLTYRSITDRFHSKIEARLGRDPRKGAKTSVLERMIEADPKALRFFAEDYKIKDGRNLPKTAQKEYYTNAIILNAIHNRIAGLRGNRGSHIKGLWEDLSKHVNDLFDLIDENTLERKYPHRLPENPRKLEDKYRKYMKEGCMSLIHKGFCNTSAAKVDSEYKEGVLMELLGDPRNFDNEQIRGIYNQMAENMGWKKITASTVEVWRDKFELDTEAGRRGGSNFMNSKAMQAKRSKPTRPLYYWTHDGWTVELLYQETVTDSKGHTRTTYGNRLTAVVVLDAFNNYPIGYAIGKQESPGLIKEALRNAVNHTAELFGQRYRAHQLQSDRYAIKTLTPLYAAIADKVTPARAHNAKSKIIEPEFKQYIKAHCQYQKNWAGFGITAKKDSQPNVDFLNKYRHDFPNEAGCRMQIDEMIAIQRAMKIDEFMQLWSKTEESDKLPLSWEQYLYWFGEETGNKNMLQGSGLKATIEGIKRDYDCFDINFRRHGTTRWSVRYDPADSSHILAMNDDESLRYVLEEKYIQPMALKDRKEGDYEELQRINEFNKKILESVTEARTKSGNAVRELLDQNPALKENTYAKLLLVDSNGQHKDVLSETREKKQNALSGIETKRAAKKITEVLEITDEDTKIDIADLMW